jgi:hypothetical protein
VVSAVPDVRAAGHTGRVAGAGSEADVRTHGFRRVEDPHGRWWRNYRAGRWWSSDRTPRSVYISGEWVHGCSFGGVGLKISTSGEETLDVAYSLGRLLRHYWKFDYTRKSGCLARLWPRFRFQVDVGLTYIDWCFGRDDGSWSRDASLLGRLRKNRLTWWRVHTYRKSSDILDSVDTVVPLDGTEYPVNLTLQREHWAKRVGPYFLAGRRHRTPRIDFYLPVWKRIEHSVHVDIPEGIPVPGNMESDFYTGQDGIYGCGCSVTRDQAVHQREWTQVAIASAIASAHRQRVRHGHGVLDTGRR